MPKHSQNIPCKICGELCWSKKSQTCNKCVNNKKRELWATATIGEKTYDKHKYAKYGYIRWQARVIAIEAGFNKCSKCGYDKHFEVCHKTPISSFPPETLISEVNKLDNLMALCPNCHWEHDHNIT